MKKQELDTSCRATFKDGSTKALEGAMSAYALAESISGGLARAALAVKLDGEVCDLDTVIEKDCAVEQSILLSRALAFC